MKFYLFFEVMVTLFDDCSFCVTINGISKADGYPVFKPMVRSVTDDW